MSQPQRRSNFLTEIIDARGNALALSYASGLLQQVTDGLGMLIEQAADSFLLWRGVRPETQSVYRELRALLSREAREPAGTR